MTIYMYNIFDVFFVSCLSYGFTKARRRYACIFCLGFFSKYLTRAVINTVFLFMTYFPLVISGENIPNVDQYDVLESAVLKYR